VPQREDRPVPNCHPDPNDFPEPHQTTALGSLWYRHTLWPKCPNSDPSPVTGPARPPFQLPAPPRANRHDVTSWRLGPHQCDIVAVASDSVRWLVRSGRPGRQLGPHDARPWPGIRLATAGWPPQVGHGRLAARGTAQESGERDVPGTRLKRRADAAVVAAARNRHFSMRGGHDVGTVGADGAIWVWRR
jgi:hypothetical protein